MRSFTNPPISSTNLLPKSSFLPLTLQRLKNARELWFNTDAKRQECLLQYAVMLPAQAGAIYLDGDADHSFVGERYGGAGLGFNGGGVRTATNGQLQIKGIGKIEQLCGSGMDYFHSYGGYSLHEAILEAIWGEICSFSLPYGGVRTLAIFDTGMRVPTKFPRRNGPKQTSRALAVRERAIRPAHFMRSVFIRHPSHLYPGYHDALRTKAAIDYLLTACEKDFAANLGRAGSTFNAVSDNFDWKDCILTIAARAAEQIAAARARRIMHGSITASNCTICGKWMDFASISAVSDFSAIVIPRGAPDFLHEHLLAMQELRDLTLQVSAHHRVRGRKEIVYEVLSHFTSKLNRSIAKEFIALFGLTTSDINLIGDDYAERMYQVIRELIAKNDCGPKLILSTDNDEIQSMPERPCSYFLPEIFRLTGMNVLEKNLDRILAVQIPDGPLRERFIFAWRGIVEKSGVQKRVYTTPVTSDLIAANCMRRNAPLFNLYRTNLYPAIERVVEETGNVSAFIDNTVDSARTIFSPADDLSDFEVFRRAGASIVFGIQAGFSTSDGEAISARRAKELYADVCTKD